MRARLAALAEQRDAIEAARKSNKKRLPLPGQVGTIHAVRLLCACGLLAQLGASEVAC